jgi:acetoin utilization deacetylase AcuC-like enzyme
MTKLIEVHSDKYARWVFDPTHPTQGRRFLNAHEQLHGLADKTVTITTVEPEFEPGIGILRLAHDEGYVDSVAKGFSGEWEGCRTDLGALALKMCGGTLVAIDGLLNPTPETEGVKTAVHFAGAKHHAQFSESSGFCVLADFAIAAHLATRSL